MFEIEIKIVEELKWSMISPVDSHRNEELRWGQHQIIRRKKIRDLVSHGSGRIIYMDNEIT